MVPPKSSNWRLTITRPPELPAHLVHTGSSPPVLSLFFLSPFVRPPFPAFPRVYWPSTPSFSPFTSLSAVPVCFPSILVALLAPGVLQASSTGRHIPSLQLPIRSRLRYDTTQANPLHVTGLNLRLYSQPDTQKSADSTLCCLAISTATTSLSLKAPRYSSVLYTALLKRRCPPPSFVNQLWPMDEAQTAPPCRSMAMAPMVAAMLSLRIV